MSPRWVLVWDDDDTLRPPALPVRSLEDELIPPASARLMTELTPQPKWVVTMPGDHINPRDPVVLTHVVNVSRDWLVARGAANEPR